MTPFYKHNGITIYCGDCLEVMPGLDKPVDAIIADLPYGTTSNTLDIIVPFQLLWKQYKRLCQGPVVLFGSMPFTAVLWASNPNDYRYKWVWEKSNSTRFLDAKKRPLQADEDVLIFSQGEHVYTPQKVRGEPNHTRKAGQYKNGSKIYKQFSSPESDVSGWKYPRTVIKFNVVPPSKKSHPFQKPVKLLEYLIRTYTNPGDIILDNTMGSGTTLLAAQNEGRHAIGIELEEEFCQIAVDRLKQPSFFSLPQQPKQSINQLSF